jgi:hypothetical protein
MNLKFDRNAIIDSWDVFDMTRRHKWYQALYCGVTLCLLGWAIIVGVVFTLMWMCD